ncbi:MAG: tetratricopeptide repeat protein [Bacteroidota bacterium]
MNRILLLISIVFLVSCSNSKKEVKSADEKESNATEQTLVDSVPVVDEGIAVLHPGGNELELGVEEGGGHLNEEIGKLFRQATSAYDQGDYQSGIQLFEQIIEKAPEDGRAYYNLGIGYFKLDKFPESIKAFNGAIDINPRDSLSIQYRGKVYYMMGDFKSCLRDYKRVVELKPEDPLAYFNRGTVKGMINDYAGAIEDFNRAIELNPEYDAAYYNRGIANFHIGKLHDACYDWRKAHILGHYEADKAIKAYCEGEKK